MAHQNVAPTSLCQNGTKVSHTARADAQRTAHMPCRPASCHRFGESPGSRRRKGPTPAMRRSISGIAAVRSLLPRTRPVRAREPAVPLCRTVALGGCALVWMGRGGLGHAAEALSRMVPRHCLSVAGFPPLFVPLRCPLLEVWGKVHAIFQLPRAQVRVAHRHRSAWDPDVARVLVHFARACAQGRHRLPSQPMAFTKLQWAQDPWVGGDCVCWGRRVPCARGTWPHYISCVVQYTIITVPTPTVAWTRMWLICTRGEGGRSLRVGRRGGGVEAAPGGRAVQ